MSVFLLGKEKWFFFFSSKNKRPFQNEFRSEVQKSSTIIFGHRYVNYCGGERNYKEEYNWKIKTLAVLRNQSIKNGLSPNFLLYFVSDL